MVKNFLILLILLFPIICKAQNQIIVDSLLIESEKTENIEDKSGILIQLSRLYWKTDYNLSVKYAKDALDILKDKNKVTYVSALRTLGNAYLFSGNYDEALKYFFQGQNLAEKLNDAFELFATTVSIGVVYDRLGNFDEAMNYNFKALGIYNESKKAGQSDKMDAGAISLYNNIGNIYLSRNELDKAEEYYQKGLALGEEKKSYYNIGSIANNLGKVKDKLNDSINALYYFNKSKDIRIANNDNSELALSYYVLAEFYLLHQNYPIAIDFANKSYNLGVEVGSVPTQKTASGILSAIYDSLKVYNKAYYYHKIFKQLSDSIINENTISELSRLKFMNQQVAIDNQMLKEKQRIKTRNTLIISILIAIIVIVTFLFLVSRFRHSRVILEKKEIENSITHKKKELATNVLYLLKKNETLESVTKKLIDVKNKVAPENRNAIQKIIFELQTEIDQESWKEFEYRFQDVHEDFYKKLQDKFPDLTPSERKLAAFLKLNMTSKEISVVTGQSIRSLEVARYRLRKKLGITNQETNLVNFLSEL